MLREEDKSKDRKTKPTKTTKTEEKETRNSAQNVEKVVLKANGKTYLADRVVGNGSFGVVVRAVVEETNEVVAIKKVLQDKRYKVERNDVLSLITKNRELQIMQQLSHPNVVELKDNFYTNGEKVARKFFPLSCLHFSLMKSI